MPSDREFVGLVRQHITSVWALELLLLLRHDPQRGWSVPELIHELRASEPLVAATVAKLEKAGLVAAEPPDGIRFRPASPLLDQFCAQLASVYRVKPFSIIGLILAQEDRLQSFADAFKFKWER